MNDGYAPGDFAPSLRKIEASQLDYFVEGGQAVNIWAEVYLAAAPESPNSLPSPPRTVTSGWAWISSSSSSRFCPAAN